MLEYIRYIQRNATVRPRIYWCEFTFYIVVEDSKKRFRFGYRPEDLSHIKTINQKVWEKHKAHINRLDRFPLDKAEYYLRLKEAHGINTVRGLSKLTGENWSCIARVLRTIDLPEQIKDYLKSNKNNPTTLKAFPLRKLIDVVQQGEERLQLSRFNELMDELI